MKLILRFTGLFALLFLFAPLGRTQQQNFPGGSGSGIGPGLNNFSPTNYAGWFGDTREVLDATWTGGGSTITCTNTNDCNFTANDNGKLCWAMPQANQAGPSAPGTFTFVSAQQGTCTASAVIGSATNNGMFTWGHDDTAAWVTAVVATFTQPKCGNLVVPAAHSMVKQGLSYLGSIAADCNFNLTGYGPDSVIEAEPGFSFSAVTTNVGTASGGPWFNTTAASFYQNFTITGEFQSLSGISTAPATALFTVPAGGLALQVNLYNWAGSASNSPNGVVFQAGTGPYTIGVAMTNWANGNFFNNTGYAIDMNGGSNTATLKTTGGARTWDYSGTFGGIYAAGGEHHGFGSLSTANNGPFGSSSCDLGSQFSIVAGKLGDGTPGTNGVGFAFNNNGSGGQCVLDAEGTLFNGGSSGSAILSAIAGQGIFIDRGNNTFNGPMTNFTGKYIPIGGGSMAARNVSATTNFGTNLTTQTLVASVVGTTNLEIKIGARQITAGASCTVASNTVFATISFTAPGGTVTTLATTTLTISGNGAVDSGAAAFQSIVIPAKVGTAVTYTTTSTLASTGCSPLPQYAIEANI